jgi:ubiquinone/menaquinone biosynthesis C-methylase UbiE
MTLEKSGQTPLDHRSFEAWNEGMVEKYDIEAYYARSSLVIRLVEGRRLHWILKLLDPRDEDKILEVGCGGGHVLERVRRGELHGIDLSPRMLALARRRLGNRAELKKCDAEHLDYADRFFDKVICTEVLEHTWNPSGVLREIRRVLKPDGTVILSVPNEDLIDRWKEVMVRARVFNLFFSNIPEENDWHLHRFNLPVLQSVTAGVFAASVVRAIPHRLFPLRYVARYKAI